MFSSSGDGLFRGTHDERYISENQGVSGPLVAATLAVR